MIISRFDVVFYLDRVENSNPEWQRICLLIITFLRNFNLFKTSYIHQFQPQFHEICSSTFIDQQWIEILFESYLATDHKLTNPYILEGTAYAKYLSVKKICNLIKEAVDNARLLFLILSIKINLKKIQSVRLNDFNKFFQIVFFVHSNF